MPSVPDTPERGSSVEIVPGVRWVRLPLPFALDHINVWALEDGDGWVLVDTGITHSDSTAAWEHILATDLGGRPVRRVIVTHMHADHAGLAGWLVQRFACPLWMTGDEYAGAQALIGGGHGIAATRTFYREAGWQDDEIDAYVRRRRVLASYYAPLPDNYCRMADGDVFVIGGREWRVVAGGGHSDEHACLYCPDLDLFISGDKVLPTISSNISVEIDKPEADPMSEWFDTLGRIRRQVPDSAMVLPSHGRCFRGLHSRIDTLVEDQRETLARLAGAVERPSRATDLFGMLFNRPIPRTDVSLMTLATGEALALLNHLIGAGKARSWIGADGVRWYQAAPSPIEGGAA